MESSVADTVASGDRALRWTRTLAEEIGPRRPTSRAERMAAEWLRAQLGEAGVGADLEPFEALSTFGLPQSIVAGLGVLPSLVPRPWRATRAALAAAATVVAAAEDDLRLRHVSRALSRAESHNLVATIEPRGSVERTLCLVSHIDTSRNGILFHPAVAPRLRRMLAVTSAAMLIQGAEPLLGRTSAGRSAVRLARTILLGALVLLAERELRGIDVPGANDNSSGAAVTAALACEVAADPLSTTRLVLLVTGAEEAGTLGADAFLRTHDTSNWLFLNFDGVCAPATLRYLPREGLLRTFPADQGLLAVARALSERRPELGLEPADQLAGLTYDATPVLARGGRALTISVQDEGRIPNYHQPTDDSRNIDPDTLDRAVEIGRELIAAVDRGEAG